MAGCAGCPGGADLYLHVRLVDAPAVALYQRSGYDTVDTDPWVMALFGQRRRSLLRKRVGPPSLAAGSYY